MTLPVSPTDGDTTWFTHDRFGLFIHWGLYALPARHEWVKNQEKVSNEDYEKYFRHFDPDLYDPALWAEAAATVHAALVQVRGLIRRSAKATLSAETLTLALGARCHEEVRVWVENFCRRHTLRVEEDSTQQFFYLQRVAS